MARSTGSGGATSGLVELLRHGLLDVLNGVDPPRVITGRGGWFRRRLSYLLALIVLLVTMGMIGAVRHNVPVPRPLAIPVAILIVAPIALLARWPLLAWRIEFAVAALLGFLAPTSGGWAWYPVELFIYLITVVVVGLRRSRGTLIWVWAFTVILLWMLTSSYGTPGHPFGDPGANSEGNAIGGTILFTTVVIAVDASGSRIRTQRALTAETERTEAEQARRAVLEERTRIARELHDVVAHHVSLIAVQAETAPYRLAGLPEAARTEFGEIGTAARASLVEMRRLLGVLRNQEPAERTPQPGLDRLPELVDSARRAGLAVELETLGERRPVPPAVDLSGYRIVQESLTNASRHAPGSGVSVLVRYQPDAVWLRISNGAGTGGPATDRRAGEPREPGHGLVGMRERAGLVGGNLSAVPTPDGGFEVTAMLPLTGQQDPTSTVRRAGTGDGGPADHPEPGEEGVP